MNVFPHDCHFGSQTEPAIRNCELCEDGYPKRCLQPREACEQSPLCTNGRLLSSCRDFQFRINELTRLVPASVRSVLWNLQLTKLASNDGVGWLFYLN